jgi:hypothetical protein
LTVAVAAPSRCDLTDAGLMSDGHGRISEAGHDDRVSRAIGLLSTRNGSRGSESHCTDVRHLARYSGSSVLTGGQG